MDWMMGAGGESMVGSFDTCFEKKEMFGFVFALKSPTWRCKRNRPFHRIMLVKNMALDKHNESNSTCNKVAVRFLPDNVVVEAEVRTGLVGATLWNPNFLKLDRKTVT
jgi:hypothetical protein